VQVFLKFEINFLCTSLTHYRTYALLLQNWNSEKMCLCGFISVVESVIIDELNIWWLQCQYWLQLLSHIPWLEKCYMALKC